MGFFSKRNKVYIGIDIGQSSIKMVELEKRENKIVLSNYGFTENNEDIKISEKKFNDPKFLESVLNKLKNKLDLKSSEVFVSLPTYEVFSSVINLDTSKGGNLGYMVNKEAKKVIPIDLEDLVLDWKVIEENKEKGTTKIFLTGSPKKTINRYVNIFKHSNFRLLSLETEIFSLIRAFSVSKDSQVMIVNMGLVNTDISIIRDDVPILNRSIDTGGMSVTKAIAGSLDISMERAEKFKKDLGITSVKSENEQVIPKTIIKTITPIINEIKYMNNLFQSKYSGSIDKIILSGGSAMLPSLPNYLSQEMDINVIVGDPWYNIEYKKELAPILNELAPVLAIPIGLAKRGIDS